MSLRKITSTLAALLVAALVVAGHQWWTDRNRVELTAEFSDAVGLYPGSDVQVLGVSVGEVTSVEPDGPVVRVGIRLDQGQEVAADTRAVLVAPTLVSDRFVQLTEPYTEGKALADGATIGMDDTAVPVEVDELYQSLEDISTQLGPDGANAEGALSDLLDVAAANLDGTGLDINRTISSFSEASSTLSGVDDDLFATIGHLADLSDMLAANDAAVSSANSQFAEVADYLAADRTDLAAAITNLGDAMAVLDDFIRDNRGNLQTSVQNLIGPTQTLVNQQASLDETVRLIPLVLQNFVNAYNPAYNTIDGRGNLLEATIWSGTGLSGQTSPSAPPVLIPGVEVAP
ncbi:MCE family protein [Aeromicrobium sp. Leaf350]|uniref:MCE family protein n=1 Tax=Aeromicrobium sp. Leaf350 TaxID=2876565 RepID=UPI001E568368|nr:MCE family protein [Aeromicrobium sp. Leaf350]